MNDSCQDLICRAGENLAQIISLGLAALGGGLTVWLKRQMKMPSKKGNQNGTKSVTEKSTPSGPADKKS